MRLITCSLFLLAFLSFELGAGEAPIKECKEAKVQGACSDMVQTAVNVCEEKQKGRDITAKRLREAKESNMGTGSNFAELEAKYKRLEDSAKSDAENQKACYESATALKKDCQDYCAENDQNGANCNKSLYSLDQIRTFCKKNEEGAEEIAEIAAQDAAMLGRTNVDTGPGSTPNAGGSTGGPATIPNIAPQLGYSGTGMGESGINNGANSSQTADALRDALLGSGAGGGGSGSGGTTGGSGASLASDGDGAGSAGAGKKKDSTGLTNSGATGSGKGESSGGGSQVTGKGDQAPGYMFWGVPAKKKKPPLTLLAKPPVQNSKSSQSSSSISTKKPPQTNQTQAPTAK